MSDIQEHDNSLDTLTKRVQLLHDTLDILALQVDYTRGADTLDGKTYAQVFSSDAVLSQANPGGIPVARGRAAIA